MFKNRKLIFLSALLMLVVLIGCASAADVNDIQQVTQDSAGEIITDEVSSAGIDDNSGLEELENENVLNSQNENSEDDVLTADISVTGNTFQDIQDAIDRASEGDTIHLDSPLYTGSGTQINVNKNLLTIIGCEGCTLTNTNGRIFNVTGSNVTLKNIAFENGTSVSYISGGAIYWSGANGTVSNCNFTKNQISRYGGAIYWTGANGTVSNCYFTNNTARSGGYGGAIYWTGANATISDNFFIKNGAIAGSGSNWGSGGAIYLTGANANISNCEFTDGNSMPYATASAIYCTGANPTIFNSSFTNNQASNHVIVLYSCKGIASISSCNFTKNRGTGWPSGTIELLTTNASISDCDFTGNVGSEGCIHWYGANGTVSNCNFTDNYDRRSGAAIYLESFNGTISNCNFTNNRANYYNGGAISAGSSNTTISNCNFINNSAPSGGAISASGNTTISNCNFTNNKGVESTDPDGSGSRTGGAISAGGNVTISNCNFTNNTGRIAGAIYIRSNGNCTLKDNDFLGNVAEYSGGAIYCYGFNGTISNCNFTNNSANDNKGGGGGGAIYSTGFNGTVSNCNFVNNNASNNVGGAIYWNASTGNIAQSNFTNNTAGRGGAIFWNASTGNIAQSNFTYNIAFSGSAIYMNSSDDGKISDSYFIDNQANSRNLTGTLNPDESILKINFTGYDNYINAIYSDNEIRFNNVTYWNGSVVNSDVATPLKSDLEKGINITLEIYDMNDNLIDNITEMTDAEGNIYYDYSNIDGSFRYQAYHPEDTYYTYKATSGYRIVPTELSISKTVNESVVTKGSLVNFTIEIRNIGKVHAPGITFADFLPNGLAFVEASEGWTWDPDRGYLMGTIDLPAGQGITLWVVANATEYGTWTNQAAAYDYSNYVWDTAIVTVVNLESPLKINKTANESVVAKGSLVNFTIEINNTGETDMTGINFADILPEGLTFVEASEGWTWYPSYGYLIGYINLPAGQGISLWVVANATEYGTWENQAIAIPRDNTYTVADTATVTVPKAPSSVSAEDVTLTYGEAAEVKVTSENATAIKYVISGEGIDDINGTIAPGENIPVPDLNAGEYTITVTTVTDDDHEPASDTAKITVQKMGTVITVDKIVNYTGAVVEVIANVTDANGNPINGGTATFTIHYDNPIGIGLLMANAKEYTTDVIDGKATFKDITLGAPGKYQSTIEYSGNGNYDSASDKSEVEILALNTTVTSDDVSGSSGEKTDIVAEVVDQNDKPVQNGTAVLKVNGKEYTAEVKDGKATFKDVELPSEDTEATIEYLGNDYYNPSNATVQITINEEPQPEPDDGNETEPDTTPEESGESEGSQTAAMEKTGNPLFLLIVAVLACLPILRRKQ